MSLWSFRATKRFTYVVALGCMTSTVAVSTDSELQRLDAGQRLAAVLTLFLSNPDAFLNYVEHPENRYYLDRGTAFEKCGETAKVVNRIVMSGTDSEINMRNRVDSVMRGLGMPTNDPANRIQVQPYFQALAVTSDLVHIVYSDGPKKFREGGTYKYFTQLNEGFINLLCQVGSVCGEEEVKQIMSGTYTQIFNTLVGEASSWCAAIPPNLQPGLADCGPPVRIASITSDAAGLTLANDNALWLIIFNDNRQTVGNWRPGEIVRVCGDSILHPDRLVRVRAEKLIISPKDRK